jgi:hypothetical protein
MGGLVKGLFGSTDTPPPPTPITPAPPPVIEDTQLQAEQQADQLRRRQGRASTIIAGAKQDTTGASPAVGTKALLGS